ncbi:uncharacterized protein J3R85_001666, partial [Psidium guajava]
THIHEPSNVQKLSRDAQEPALAASVACEGPCHSPLVGVLHGGGRGEGTAHELCGDRDAGRGHGLVGGGHGGWGEASPKAWAPAQGHQACGATCAHGVVPKWAAWPHGGGACACHAQVARHTRLGLGQREPPS